MRIADVDPELAAKWATRAETYGRLVQATRDLGGILGAAAAAGQGSIAASRADKLTTEPPNDTKQLHQLDRLFARIDKRVCAAVESGAKERLYFLRVPLPRIDSHAHGMVKTQRHRFVPLTSPVQSDLVGIVRNTLCPEPRRVCPPTGAARSRADFAAAITHRPGDPGPAVSL
jgi:hypothetical protein